jgi:hypothetical protein
MEKRGKGVFHDNTPGCSRSALPADTNVFFLFSGAETTEKIASLSLFAQQSGCTFIRNGNHYDALTARDHIEKNIIIIKIG